MANPKCFRCGQWCDAEAIKRHGKNFCSSCADAALFQSPLVGTVAGLPVSPSQGAQDALAGIKVAFEMMRGLQSPPPANLPPGASEEARTGYGNLFGEPGGEPTGVDWRNLPVMAREYAAGFEPPRDVPPGEDVGEKLVNEAVEKRRRE